MRSAEEALQRLCDPASKVSAHYVVEEDGAVHALVPENDRAWHAGVSCWRGNTNINQRSIGIEMVNPGHEFGYRAFPDVQIQSVMALCKEILSRHSIPARNVVGHSDVAPERKEDPGELFPWGLLAENGIGLWSDKWREHRHMPGRPAPDSVHAALVQYGYNPAADLKKLVTAFQRHFRPWDLTGEWDAECNAMLADLTEQAK